MPGQPPAVTLREVTGDPEELAALQRVMESDEGFALPVTGHPPGPADAQSTLMHVPEGSSPDDKVTFGVWADGELVGVLDLLLRYPDDETLYIGLLIDRARQGQGLGAAACQALEVQVRARWPWVRRLRLGVVRTNDQVLGFWRRTGFAETGELRPWRYDTQSMMRRARRRVGLTLATTGTGCPELELSTLASVRTPVPPRRRRCDPIGALSCAAP